MSLLDQARNKTGGDSWQPETKGDGVEGTVVSITWAPSEFNADVLIPTVILEKADGKKVRVIGFRTVLRTEIEQEAPKPGDLMAAVYMGTEKLKKGKFAGRDVHVYRVVVQKAGSPATEGNEAQAETVPF